MKSLTLTRGVALTGALTLSHVVTASAATAVVHVAHMRHVASAIAATPAASSAAENTPLNLGGSATAHAAGGSSLVRTIVGLFVVIAVVYGVAWILRQFKKSQQTQASGTGLSALSSLPLGGGRSVQLVRAGHEILLLGVSEHGITHIRTYTEEEALDAGLAIVAAGEDGEPAAAPARAALSSLRVSIGTGGRGREQLRELVDTLRKMTIRS